MTSILAATRPSRSATPGPQKVKVDQSSIKENSNQNSEVSKKKGLVAKKEVSTHKLTLLQRAWRIAVTLVVGAIIVALVVAMTPQLRRDSVKDFFGNTRLLAGRVAGRFQHAFPVVGFFDNAVGRFRAFAMVDCFDVVGHFRQAFAVVGSFDDVVGHFRRGIAMVGGFDVVGQIQRAFAMVGSFDDVVGHFRSAFAMVGSFDFQRAFAAVGYFDEKGYLHASFSHFHATLAAFGVTLLASVRLCLLGWLSTRNETN